MNNYSCALILMQKDETDLLSVWIDYHGSIFGHKNLYIFDNGSLNQKSIDILNSSIIKGVNVYWNFCENADYKNKPNIFGRLINEFDKNKKYDFIFPLDSDEFIACNIEGEISSNKSHIMDALSMHFGQKKVLRILASYDNIPIMKDMYFFNELQKKCFFFSGTFKASDHGFHDSYSKECDKEFEKTNIVYIHMHNRLHDDYIRSAKNKLSARGITNFDSKILQKYLDEKKDGYHVINYLMIEARDYYMDIFNRYISRPELVCKINGFKDWAEKIKFHAGFPSVPTKDLVFSKIDSFKFEHGKLVIAGWAIHLMNIDLTFRLYIDGNFYPAYSYLKINRPDVIEKFPIANLDCGFSCSFECPNFNNILAYLCISTSDSDPGILNCINSN